eukprot:CAMPEP_0206215202 /NCGR_PEP_ID=MMETSP0047_2-20121206/2066_1 /ASSEMBLY_ACC=CAM_ASM_000192 /TAXON_ID=195065 /ORGANISM="Chroomonas mesostigmatica_cf, Strain CCMP1168" /LENGTH=33 /DNA_ID= /DNA_START= /DNA_END= /DNA_ORIENTATION=
MLGGKRVGHAGGSLLLLVLCLGAAAGAVAQEGG